MLKNKTKDEKKKSPYTVRSEAVTLNLKASNSTLFFLLCFREKTPAPRWFYCHCITFSATLLSGGGGRGWLFVLRTAAALCCRWGKWTFLRQFQPTPEQRPGFISAGACWSSLLTAEILRCSLPECKKEKHSGEIKKWGHGCYYKVESFPAGFISAKCNLLSCWNEWGTK